VIAAFKQFIRKKTPKGIRTEVRVLSASPAVMVDPSHLAIQTAAQAFSDVFGGETVYIRDGGSIPIVGDFAQHLGIPTVLMGFGLPDDGLHGPNEKFCLENYYKGILTVAHFLERYGQ
jgi:acetylornithine deacetylase/succinyl-diaminopimelate desuccinylase-like protein